MNHESVLIDLHDKLTRAERWQTTLLQKIEAQEKKIMAAIDDLKEGQTELTKAVGDVVAFLNNLAGQILPGGVSAADAEDVANDIKAKAAALEAAITPAAPVNPPAAS